LKAFALVNGRTFVTEDDLRGLTHAVLDHRLIYRNKEAKQKALTLIVGRELDRLSKLKLTINRTEFAPPSENI
jgi:MoxR-like ATPase